MMGFYSLYNCFEAILIFKKRLSYMITVKPAGQPATSLSKNIAGKAFKAGTLSQLVLDFSPCIMLIIFGLGILVCPFDQLCWNIPGFSVDSFEKFWGLPLVFLFDHSGLIF